MSFKIGDRVRNKISPSLVGEVVEAPRFFVHHPQDPTIEVDVTPKNFIFVKFEGHGEGFPMLSENLILDSEYEENE